MREQALKIAAGAMTAVLGVVLMVLGTAVGLGIYLSPMLAGLCLLPAGRTWGVKYHLLISCSSACWAGTRAPAQATKTAASPPPFE